MEDSRVRQGDARGGRRVFHGVQCRGTSVLQGRRLVGRVPVGIGILCDRNRSLASKSDSRRMSPRMRQIGERDERSRTPHLLRLLQTPWEVITLVGRGSRGLTQLDGGHPGAGRPRGEESVPGAGRVGRRASLGGTADSIGRTAGLDRARGRFRKWLDSKA